MTPDEAPLGSARRRQSANVDAQGPQPANRKARWAELLRAADALFSTKGYSETSMQDLASYAGLVNKGSVYYYIESKEDLLFELAIRAHTDVLNKLENGDVPRGSGPLEHLAGFIEWWIRYQWEGSANSWIARELRSLNRENRASVIVLREEFESYVEKIVRVGVSDGTFDPGLNAKFVTKTIFILLRREVWFDESEEQTLDEIISWFQRFILKGLSITD